MPKDQFYLFTMPGDICLVWAEFYSSDGTHMVAPSPCIDIKDAATAILSANPYAIVDELDLDSDIEQCREWARTCPLEQISQ